MENQLLNDTENKTADSRAVVKIENLKVFYDNVEAVKGVNMVFEDKKVHSIIGPSGCGKSTVLRSLNLLHSLTPNARIEGSIKLDDENILDQDPMTIRRRIGMVFQRPNPFPHMSIADNVLAGYKMNNIQLSKTESYDIVEYALKKAALWKEVKGKLNKRGTFLSGGQQQRLCIARAIAMGPEVLLLDEPTSALDPITTVNIEELIMELRESMSIVIVTHNMQQAARISDKVAFMYLGELIEYDTADVIFSNPTDKRTDEYINGVFG